MDLLMLLCMAPLSLTLLAAARLLGPASGRTV